MLQYILRFMYIVPALFCFDASGFYPYSSGLLHWQWGNRKIAPQPVKQSWRIWVIQPHEFTNNWYCNHSKTKQNKTKKCAYIMGCTTENWELSWCQLCCHKHQRLLYQPDMLPVMTKLVSWSLWVFSDCVDWVFLWECGRMSMTVAFYVTTS